MSPNHRQPGESDLDRTDRLPILEGETADQDMEDDAVPLEQAAPWTASAVAANRIAPSDFARPPRVDLPMLAESVRSIEDRIARQGAEYELLSRMYEKARDAEAEAVSRANALGAELAAAQSALATEQRRTRELDVALAERNAAGEASRARVEEIQRDAERQQNEVRMLRESLAARDATIVQLLHSLGERDAQLYALQREHAKVVPALEARSQASAQLEAEVQALRSEIEAGALELQEVRRSETSLGRR